VMGSIDWFGLKFSTLSSSEGILEIS